MDLNYIRYWFVNWGYYIKDKVGKFMTLAKPVKWIDL